MPRAVRIGRHRIAVADDQPTFWDRVEAGRWEPGTLLTLDALVQPGCVFVDLGAWVGPLSLYAAARGALALAVEADPAALDGLRRNLAANPDLAARVTVVPRAVSATAAPVRMGSRRKPGDSMSSILLADGAQSWTAEPVTPGELADLLPADRMVVVKLDIEGGEYALLPALGPLLARAAAVLASWHPGILAEAGEPDPLGRLAAALTPLAGWSAAVVGSSGAEGRGEAPGAVLAAPDRDSWLFRPPPALPRDIPSR